MCKEKYVGARTLWSSERSINGTIYSPGDLLPPDVMPEDQACARADMKPEYEKIPREKVPVSPSIKIGVKFPAKKGKSPRKRLKNSLA